ncbi:MAG: hypothetical protein OEL83_13910 [Desulforhopalus sp.]|nr:hypothetical protein [Desulforhopalus sp.]
MNGTSLPRHFRATGDLRQTVATARNPRRKQVKLKQQEVLCSG